MHESKCTEFNIQYVCVNVYACVHTPRYVYISAPTEYMHMHICIYAYVQFTHLHICIYIYAVYTVQFVHVLECKALTVLRATRF